MRKKMKTAGERPKIVSFDHEQLTYQIDPAQKKVYRRFVEIETARASEILSVWRATDAG